LMGLHPSPWQWHAMIFRVFYSKKKLSCHF
jgi:hypothetical protein